MMSHAEITCLVDRIVSLLGDFEGVDAVRIEPYEEAISIQEGDVLFENNDVRVLRPDFNGGVVVYLEYDHSCEESIGENGLPLDAGVELNGIIIDYQFIVFRAPESGHSAVPAHPTVAEINKNYSDGRKIQQISGRGCVFCIRIDPFKTFVYSSDAGTKITLVEYQKNIHENTQKEGGCYTEGLPQINAGIIVSVDIPVAWRVGMWNSGQP
jgi:hypothetical protein